jgi:hypothetical protein
LNGSRTSRQFLEHDIELHPTPVLHTAADWLRLSAKSTSHQSQREEEKCIHQKQRSNNQKNQRFLADELEVVSSSGIISSQILTRHH